MAKKENTTSIGFEDAIWRAADKLRGNLNASEYEGVVLPLTEWFPIDAQPPLAFDHDAS